MLRIKDLKACKRFSTRQDEIKYLMSKIKTTDLCLEFGVWSGVTINCAAEERPENPFFGFDTFTGLPEEWDTGNKLHKVGHFDMGGHMPTVHKNVKLIKGLFEDTLEDWWKVHNGPIAYLNIDSDIYSAAKFVLKTLDGGIIPGTILRFDELIDPYELGWISERKYPNWKEHEWKALNEWLEEFNREVVPISGSDKCSITFKVVDDGNS